MENFRRSSVVILLASAIFLSSCLGSFKLTNTVYDWNMNVGDNKFVNELVFLLCVIVPVYEVSLVIDGLVLNSIEFWSGNNPMAMKDGDKQERLVEAEGKTYRLTSEKYKMTIEELNSTNKATEMVFRAEDNSWYLKKGNKLQKLIEVEVNDGKVTSYRMTYPDGTISDFNTGFDPTQVQNQILAGQTLAVSN